MQTARLQAHVFQQILEDGEAAARMQIARDVVAVARMATAHPDSIRALAECGENEVWTEAAGAGDADHSDVVEDIAGG
jgi:hypothetical protein